MEYCRAQTASLLIIGYIGFMYFRECKRYHKKMNSSIFGQILMISIFCIIFDGITAITVNNLENVNEILNKMSLEQCFAIIEQGSGQNFDPLLAEVFLECRENVEKIHNGLQTKQYEEEIA